MVGLDIMGMMDMGCISRFMADCLRIVLVDRIFAPMSEFRESLPTRRAQSSLARSLAQLVIRRRGGRTCALGRSGTPLTLVRWHRAGGGDLLPALDVAGEAADLADDALPRQADHDGGAVVALERRRERPDEELVRFRLRAHLQSIHQI